MTTTSSSPSPTETEPPRHGERPSRSPHWLRETLHGWPSWLDPVLTAVGGAIVFWLGFGDLSRLARPLGGGDLLPAYATSHLWSAGTVFGNTSLGFPFGMELRYYPTADVFQNATAGIITAVTGNTFLGVNLMYALTWPLVALCALWVFRIVRLRGPIAVVFSLAFTAIPFHWLRNQHVYLGTLYSVVLGIGLALLVGNGWVERNLRGPHRVRTLLMLVGLAVIIGGSGIYYACFTILFCGVAWVYRIARGSRGRRLLAGLVPLALVMIALAAFLTPSFLYTRANPPLIPVADRLTMESIEYTGPLVFTLLPLPLSEVPGMGPLNTFVQGMFHTAVESGEIVSGVLDFSNFGSLATTLAMLLLAVGAVVRGRRRARVPSTEAGAEVSPATAVADPGQGERVTFGFITLLLVTSLLFYIPFGLNFLFAELITPQLRGWDRLTPALLLLVMVGGAIAWRELRLPWRGPWALGLSIVMLVVLALDSIIPYRVIYTRDGATAIEQQTAGAAYATAVNAAVPEHCGVLQLPAIAYPEEPNRHDLGGYEHFYVALTNTEKSWSFGAMKNTVAMQWMQRLGTPTNLESLDQLARAGFCLVHVDRRGFTPEDSASTIQNLRDLMGEPVATGLSGNWLAFRLPEPSGQRIDPRDLDSLSADDRAFWAP